MYILKTPIGSNHTVINTYIKTHLHDFGSDRSQHVLQTLCDSNIGPTVHVSVYRDDLQ